MNERELFRKYNLSKYSYIKGPICNGRMITRVFLRLLPVQMVLVAITGLNSLIDGAIASNFIGKEAMLVVGLYLPVIRVVQTINIVLLSGTQILCGKLLGKNQIEKTGSIFSLDLFFVLCISVSFSILTFIFPDNLSIFLKKSSSDIGNLSAYIRGISIGIPFHMLGIQFLSFLQMEKQEKRAFAGVILMMTVNIFGDLFFVCFLKKSYFGLGLATSLSYIVFFLVPGIWYFSKKAVIRASFRSLDFKLLSEILITGAPGAVVEFCLAIRGFFLNDILFHYSGTDGVAALSSVFACGSLLFAVTSGVGMATTILTSVYIGEEDRSGIVLIMKTALIKGLIATGIVSAVFIIFSYPLARLFFSDTTSNVFFLTKWAFRLYPLTMPLSTVFAVMVNYYQSAQRMKIVNILSGIDGVGGVMIFAMLLSPSFGAMGTFVSMILSGIFVLLCIFVYTVIKNRGIPGNMEELLTMPDDFGVGKENRVDITINEEGDIDKYTGYIPYFCEKRGISAERAKVAETCVRGCSEKIVKYGFNDEKIHSVDIRIIYKNDDLTIRIKNDCEPLNSMEKKKIFGEQSVENELVILRKYLKSVQSNNVLGLNVMTIVL